MFVKIFRGYESKCLLLETKSVILNKESVILPSDIIPFVFRMVDELNLPVDESDYKRIDKIKEMAEKTAKEDDVCFNFDDLFGVLLPDRSFCNVELVLSDDEMLDKNNVFSKMESTEPKERCMNYKISSITVDGRTYLTTGSIYVMNDDGKTIDKV